MLKKHLQYERVSSGVNQLLFNGKSLQNTVDSYSGPAFIYDLDLVQNRFQALSENLPGVQIHYAMKANANHQILKHLKSLGSHVDVVSGGELICALECGFKPRDVIFSGVAKTKKEIEQAIQKGIHQINVESLAELKRIIQISTQLNKKISIALRLNPDIEIKTHKYIATGLLENKFGLEFSLLPEIISIIKSQSLVELAGISLHLGSQMLEFSGLQAALKKTKEVFLNLQKELKTCQRFDFGGGLGVLYEEINPEKELSLLQEYAKIIRAELSDLKNTELQTEPGRWLVAHSGILICQVQYIKTTSQKVFMMIDSGMNHLVRPSLYEAYHWMGPHILKSNQTEKVYDVVGPICESSDFFAKARKLPELQENDILVIADCGAYGASMSSDYNLQARAQEIILA